MHRNGTGDYQLVAGQRRVTAARMAGLSEIEVVVRDYSDGSTPNAAKPPEHRAKALSDVEEAVAYQELLDLGITSDDIASIVGTTTKRIGEYVSAFNLPKKVRRELSSGAINFDEALMLTQPGDTPERLNAALRNAHNGWNLASAVQHELHEREVQRKIAASQEELEKRGVPIVEQPRETFSRRTKVQRLGNGWGCIPITPAKHAKEPCHAACIDSYGGDIIYLCTDVQRHAGVVPGIEAPEDRKAARGAKRAERQAEKLAVEARRTVLAKRLQIAPIRARRPTIGSASGSSKPTTALPPSRVTYSASLMSRPAIEDTRQHSSTASRGTRRSCHGCPGTCTGARGVLRGPAVCLAR